MWVRKNLASLEGCQLIDYFKYLENRDEELQLEPMLLNLVKLVEISLAALLLNYVNVGRRQAIEAIISGLANLLLENYQKIYMIFNILK